MAEGRTGLGLLTNIKHVLEDHWFKIDRTETLLGQWFDEQRRYFGATLFERDVARGELIDERRKLAEAGRHIDALTSRLEILGEARAERDAARGELAEHRGRLEVTRGELADERRKLLEAGRHIDGLIRRIDDLTGLNNDLTVRAAALDSRNAELTGRVADLSGTLAATEQARAALDGAVPPNTPEHAYANLAEWHRAIREGVPNYPGLEDGIQAVMPVFAAETAARERREAPAKLD